MKEAPEASGRPIRLQRYLALCGVSSRRAAEKLIEEGRVSVDGLVVRKLGTKVDPDRQRVEVDGRPVRPEAFEYWLYHKPQGVLSAMRDPFGRPTVGALTPSTGVRLFHVGRLDRDSEGLLLMTNDGEMAARLMHPRYGVPKTYEVHCARDLSPADMRRLVQEGVEEGGERLKALALARKESGRYEVVLAEGKKREVRRMFSACGAPVRRLIRIALGPLRLEGLEAGQWRRLRAEEIAALKRAVGLRAAPARIAAFVQPDSQRKRGGGGAGGRTRREEDRLSRLDGREGNGNGAA